MGAVYGKSEKPQTESQEEAVEEVPYNGFLFNDLFLPPEVVAHILTFLEPTLNGRLVCRAWRDIIDTVVWREKVLREVPGAFSNLFQYKELTWQDFNHLCLMKPHKKNLVRNGSAEDKFDHWVIRSVRYDGSRWKIEREPIGCDPFPAGIRSCFVTSYDWCSAEQVIILHHYGLTRNFMKHVRPDIHIEEWYAGRFDCGFEYSLKVTLLNNSWDSLDSFVFETRGHTSEWMKVEHVFSNYQGEVTMIVFHHKGKDTQYWAGQYGCKMSGAKVYVTLPRCQEEV